jgi:hypothetical protein
VASLDSPDWQKVVTIVTSGSVTDAPDWQRIVTGPSGGSVPGAAGLTDGWTAALFGVGAWTFPPHIPGSGTTSLIRGVLYLTFMPVGVNCTVSNMTLSVVAGQSSPTANENYLGIYEYNYSGGHLYNRVATTAAGTCDAGFASGTNQTHPLSASVSLTAGHVYYAALLCNGSLTSMQVAMSAAGSGAATNPSGFFTNFVVSGVTFAEPSLAQTYLTGQTSLPATIGAVSSGFAPGMMRISAY